MLADALSAGAAALAGIAFIFWVAICAHIVLFRRDHHTLRKAPDDCLAVQDLTVSVVVPAHNEAADLEHCLRSILGQTHQRLELIVADDRSTDATASIAQRLATEDGRVRVIRIDHLPSAWTGKTQALTRGARAATAEWLLFTDADTHHSAGCLAAALHYATQRGLVLLSGWPATAGHTWISRLVDPFCGTVLASWYRRRGQRAQRRFAPFANGQFLLIRADTFRQVGGFETIKDRLLEDVALARLLNRHGLPFEVVLLHELLRVRTYATLAESLRGWSRIFQYGAAGNVRRLIRRAVVLFAIAVAGYLALGAGAISLTAAGSAGRGSLALMGIGGAAIAAMTVSTALVCRHARVALGYALLAPVSAILTTAFLAVAARDAWADRAVEWHGITYRGGIH